MTVKKIISVTAAIMILLAARKYFRTMKKSNPPKPPSWTLITGATGELGNAIARKCLENGMQHLLLVGRNSSNTISNLRTKLLENHKNATIVGIRSDFTKLENLNSIGAVVSQVLSTHSVKKIGHMFFCAGMARFESFQDSNKRTITNQLFVNAFAPIILTHSLLPLSFDDAQFFYISSLIAQIPTPFLAVYAAAKACLSQFCLSIRNQVTQSIILFEPGNFTSPFYSKMFQIHDLHLKQNDVTIVNTPDMVDRIFDRMKNPNSWIIDPVGTSSSFHYFVKLFFTFLPRTWSGYLLGLILSRSGMQSSQLRHEISLLEDEDIFSPRQMLTPNP